MTSNCSGGSTLVGEGRSAATVHLSLARGQGGPDVSLFGERAMATGNRGAGDGVFPQRLAYSGRGFRTVDRAARRDEIGHIQNVPRRHVCEEKALDVGILNVVEANFGGIILKGHLVLHFDDLGSSWLSLQIIRNDCARCFDVLFEIGLIRSRNDNLRSFGHIGTPTSVMVD